MELEATKRAAEEIDPNAALYEEVKTSATEEIDPEAVLHEEVKAEVLRDYKGTSHVDFVVDIDDDDLGKEMTHEQLMALQEEKGWWVPTINVAKVEKRVPVIPERDVATFPFADETVTLGCPVRVKDWVRFNKERPITLPDGTQTVATQEEVKKVVGTMVHFFWDPTKTRANDLSRIPKGRNQIEENRFKAIIRSLLEGGIVFARG